MKRSYWRVSGVALVIMATTMFTHAQDQRAQWNAPQAPFRVFGNTY